MPPGVIEATRATPPPYGLEVSARVVVDGSDTDGDTRWVDGITWQPEDCTGGGIIDPCGTSGGSEPTTAGVVGPHMAGLVEAAVECSTFGSIDTEMRDRARRKLRATRSASLEAELWTGAMATVAGWTNNQRFQAGGSVTLIEGGSATGYVTALAELEQAIANGSDWAQGMIHAMPRTVAHWSENGLLTKVGNLLVTALGTVVVAGRGYPGLGPSGQTIGATPADRAWAYATTMVEVRFGNVVFTTDEPAAGVDREHNTRLLRAQQFASANWDGCVLAAANVLHTTARSTTGS